MSETTDTAARARELLSDTDVAILNAARGILGRVENAYALLAYDCASGVLNDPTAGGCGRVAGACDRAEHAVFEVLSAATIYGAAGLTDDQVHNRGTGREGGESA